MLMLITIVSLFNLIFRILIMSVSEKTMGIKKRASRDLLTRYYLISGPLTDLMIPHLRASSLS